MIPKKIVKTKEEGYNMETKPVVSRYPLCRKLGIVSYLKGEPRILLRDLKDAFTPQELFDWNNWSVGITQDSLGIFAWDVERFLSGLSNND